MPSIVAFDLETTGLDPKSDAIIEIAMVRFNEDGTVEEFSSLVNPGISISEEVENITGITDEDVSEAPGFGDIRHKVADFFGDDPVLAHNADFDTAFLSAYGFDFSNRVVIDSFKIAQLAFRHEKSMNLSNLADASGYFHEGAHRALSDTRATVAIFRESVRRIKESQGAVNEIYRFLRDHSAPNSSFPATVRWALGDDDPTDARKVFEKIEAGLSEYVEAPAPERPFDAPDAVSILERNSGLEKRPEQAKMAGIVRDAVDNKSLVAIEAPTGIGKTFAYMVPAVASAILDGARVHVSTNTKTLQDQIAHKDVPRIRDILRPYGLDTFRFAKLKGRSNYVSLLKFAEFADREDFPEEAKLFFAKVAILLAESKTGELDEVSFYGKDYEFLAEIHAGDARVLSPDNPYRKKEPLYCAREAAKTADVVLVNHALILTELAEDASGTVGKLSRLVVDEAHNLEAAATDALTCELLLADIEKTFGRIEAHIRRHNRQSGAEKFLFPEMKEISESFVLSYGMALDFAERYAFVKAGMNDSGRGGYAGGRSTDVLVTQDFFTSEGISGMPSVISSVFEKLKDLVGRLEAAPDKLFEAFSSQLTDLSGYAKLLEEFFSASRTDLIKTVSLKNNGECKLALAPLDVSGVLKERLWSKLDSVVLTSATLAIGGNFDFLKKTLGLQDFTFHILDSDFDYHKQATVFLPDDLGDVKSEFDRRRVNAFVARAIVAMGGRTLCLFTSFASIKEAYLQANPILKKAGIQLLSQGMSGGKHKMIEQFKKYADHSALFGTDSFWEGVDIPGKDLEMLFIHKFPFAVPTDPIVMARSKLFRDPFAEYSVPQMLLKLRQGIGRLIRTKEDRGVVVILDPRVNSSWGRAVP